MGQGGKTVCASAKNVEKYSQGRTAFQETRKPFSLERIKTLKFQLLKKGRVCKMSQERKKSGGRNEKRIKRGAVSVLKVYRGDIGREKAPVYFF